MSTLITAEYFNENMATLGLKQAFSPTAYALNTLITEASDWVEDYTDRTFALHTAIEVIRGPVRQQHRLVLDDFPVTSVTSITSEDNGVQPGTVDVTRLRILRGGVLEFKNYAYEFDPRVVYTVTYQAGYAVIPSNVQRATALKVAILVQPQYQGPQEREIFMTTNLEALIIDLLEPFRRERYG